MSEQQKPLKTEIFEQCPIGASICCVEGDPAISETFRVFIYTPSIDAQKPQSYQHREFAERQAQADRLRKLLQGKGYKTKAGNHQENALDDTPDFFITIPKDKPCEKVVNEIKKLCKRYFPAVKIPAPKPGSYQQSILKEQEETQHSR